MNKTRYRSCAAAAVTILTSVMVITSRPLPGALAEPLAAKPQPVETDMHEFMEYAFQPTYKRLKQSIAAEPVDNAGWKAIKADALILAEGGNLLLLHRPQKDAAIWDGMSVAVRDSGSNLYQAAKAKDFITARQQYEQMLTRCNACHDRFADGEHQLGP